MTDSEIVEAARRYPTVEEIATLLHNHRLISNGRYGWLCATCDFKTRSGTNRNNEAERAHLASVIVAMWEELAREAEK